MYSSTKGDAGQQIINFARGVLAFLRKMWRDGRNPPGSDELSLYYSVSEYIAPLPEGPDLRPIWSEAWNVAREEIDDFEPEEPEIYLDGLLEWGRILDSIAANEPRFLRQVGFPLDYAKTLAPLLPLLKVRVELRFDLEYGQDCTDEEDRMDTVSDIASLIADQTKDLEVEARCIAGLAKENGLRAERMRRDMEERESEEARGREANGSGKGLRPEEPVPERNPLDDLVNIAQLFQDL